MNRKTLLFLFLALTSGLLLGYTGRNRDRASETLPGKDASNHSSISSQFGAGQSPSSSASPVRSAKAPFPEWELDRCILRYSRMNTEEMWTELEQLSKLPSDYSSRDPILKTQMFYLCTRLGEKVPRQTLDKINTFKNAPSSLKSMVLEAWGEKNPEAAAAYCQEKMAEMTSNKREFRDFFVEFTSKTSPEKALEWISHLPPQERISALYSALFAMKQTPQTLEDALKKSKFDFTKDKWSSQTIAGQFARLDWDTARQWIDTLPESYRTQVLENAIGSMPLDKAGAQLSLLGEKEKEKALHQLVSSHSYSNAQKTLEWLAGNIDDNLAAKAVSEGFYSRNIAQLYPYVDNMRAGELKDSVLQKIIDRHNSIFYDNGFKNTQVEDVLFYVNKIGSSEKREEAMDSTLSQWISKSPEKTRSIVEQSGMSAEKKKEYIEKCDQYIRKNNS